MTFVNLLTFLGRLHPLIVHLPIGILLLSLVLDLISYRKGQEHLKSVVTLTLLLGSLSAILACVLGYLLSLSGDYAYRALNDHKISGIVVAAFSALLYLFAISRFKFVRSMYPKVFTVMLFAMSGALTYAGHQGGVLTHGEEYLSVEVLTKQKRPRPERIEDAYLYEDIVQPILEKRCAQCHQGGKKKGNLSIASVETLLKGGKNGPAVVPGKPDESELIKRISLPEDDEEFMPSEGKTPLTKGEKQIIEWWIRNAAAGSGVKLTALQRYNTIVPQVQKFLKLTAGDAEVDNETGASSVNTAIPDTLDPNLIENLRGKGVIVRVMLQDPVMLDVTVTPESRVRIPDVVDEMRAVSKNIIWFNASGIGATDEELTVIKDFTNMEKLRLEKNPVGDGIGDLIIGLKYLAAVNLYETNITDDGVRKIKDNPSIKRVYVWNSKVTAH